MTELIKLFFNLQLFSEGTEGTEGADAGQGIPTGGDEKQTEPFAVFPDQESFNKRLSREAKKHLNDTLAELGVSSLDELKAFMDEKKAKEEAEKSELQKAQELIQQLQQEKESYNKQMREAKQMEVMTAKAQELGVKPDRVKHLLRFVDTDSIYTDGELDMHAVEEAIRGVLVEFPEFKNKIEAQAGTDFNETGSTGAKPTLTMEMIKGMSTAQIAERIDEVRAVMSAK